MNATNETAEQIGQRIGRAIARDAKAEGMPRGWTGLDAQDAEQIPSGIDCESVERVARAEYERAMSDTTTA